MSKTLCKLYLGDSSDDDETSFTTQSIHNKLELLKNSKNVLFASSFLLLEISQSIIESKEVRIVYNKKKKQLMKENKIINEINQEQFTNEKVSEILVLTSEAYRYTKYSPILDNYYKHNTDAIEDFCKEINLCECLYHFKADYFTNQFMNMSEFEKSVELYFPIKYCSNYKTRDYNLAFSKRSSITFKQYFLALVKECQKNKNWFAYLLNIIAASAKDKMLIETYIHFRKCIIDYLILTDLSIISRNFLTAVYITQTSASLYYQEINREISIIDKCYVF